MQISSEELQRSALDAAFVRQLDCLEGALRCTHLRRCFKVPRACTRVLLDSTPRTTVQNHAQNFIAESEDDDSDKQSFLQCMLFWVEVERYRCCTSQWQPGSGFPEAYAAWISGKYVSTGVLGIDVGAIEVETDLVRHATARLMFLLAQAVALLQVGAFDRAQHTVFQHLDRTM